MRLVDTYMADTGIFLGVPIADWLRVLKVSNCRGLTVVAMLEQFEADHPSSMTDYYAWKERHGVMAEVLELNDATKT